MMNNNLKKCLERNGFERRSVYLWRKVDIDGSITTIWCKNKWYIVTYRSVLGKGNDIGYTERYEGISDVEVVMGYVQTGNI